jgi:hypothetical protein
LSPIAFYEEVMPRSIEPIRYFASIIVSMLFLNCQDTGEEPVLGPFAATDKTTYAAGDPVTVTIGSDNPVITFNDCFGAPPFFLDFLVTDGWTEWSDHATKCMGGNGFPTKLLSVGEGSTYVATIVLPTDYPGTYRFRFQCRTELPFPGRSESIEIVTNEFLIEE